MQASGLRHGRQGSPFTADVTEDLKHHETQEEEVETGTDSCHNYEGHLRRQWSRKRSIQPSHILIVILMLKLDFCYEILNISYQFFESRKKTFASTMFSSHEDKKNLKIIISRMSIIYSHLQAGQKQQGSHICIMQLCTMPEHVAQQNYFSSQ